MRFIKLHTARKNECLIVNINSIGYVKQSTSSSSKGKIYVYIKELNDDVYVNENVEDIYRQISRLDDNKSFLKLHLTNTNTPAIINTDYVSCINAVKEYNKYFSRVNFNFGNSYMYVYESVDKIFNMSDDCNKQDNKKTVTES